MHSVHHKYPKPKDLKERLGKKRHLTSSSVGTRNTCFQSSPSFTLSSINLNEQAGPFIETPWLHLHPWPCSADLHGLSSCLWLPSEFLKTALASRNVHPLHSLVQYLYLEDLWFQKSNGKDTVFTDIKRCKWFHKWHSILSIQEKSHPKLNSSKSNFALIAIAPLQLPPQWFWRTAAFHSIVLSTWVAAFYRNKRN